LRRPQAPIGGASRTQSIARLTGGRQVEPRDQRPERPAGLPRNYARRLPPPPAALRIDDAAVGPQLAQPLGYEAAHAPADRAQPHRAPEPGPQNPDPAQEARQQPDVAGAGRVIPRLLLEVVADADGCDAVYRTQQAVAVPVVDECRPRSCCVPSRRAGVGSCLARQCTKDTQQRRAAHNSGRCGSQVIA